MVSFAEQDLAKILAQITLSLQLVYLCIPSPNSDQPNESSKLQTIWYVDTFYTKPLAPKM